MCKHTQQNVEYFAISPISAGYQFQMPQGNQEMKPEYVSSKIIL